MRRSAALIAVLLVAACAEHGEPAAEDAAADTVPAIAGDPAALKACDLVNEAELEQILAVDLAAARTTNDYAGDSQCKWDLPGDGQRGVSVSLRQNFGLSNYRVPGAVTVAGVGDSAVWNASAGQLAAQKDTRVVSIGVLLDDPAREDAERIARIALEKL